MAKQQLNSLDRFRKQPGRLVLEEHSHCEVPAGCGGVVLRWRNPLTAVPLVVHVYTPVQGEIFLAGKLLEWSRIDLAPGRHVAAIVLRGVELHRGLLLFAAQGGPQKDTEGTRPTQLKERPFRVLSREDGTWKGTLTQPGDDWLTLSFDDSTWPALLQNPTPELDRNDHGSYQCRECTELGAACLGLPAGPDVPASGDVWIRHVFTVPGPRPINPGTLP